MAIPKLLVFGGNGYVGSHVCQEALRSGIPVACVSRSGRPAGQTDAWADQVDWVRADALQPSTYQHLLPQCLGVVSCIGLISTSQDEMRKINGAANRALIHAAADAGVARVAYVSAHDYHLPGDLLVLKGYFEGKREAEAALAERFPTGGVALRPGFIHGTRKWGSISIPLSLIGSPLAGALSYLPTQTLASVPVAGAAFVPPVSVESVAKALVAAATDSTVPAGTMDVWKISEYR